MAQKWRFFTGVAAPELLAAALVDGKDEALHAADASPLGRPGSAVATFVGLHERNQNALFKTFPSVIWRLSCLKLF